MTKFNPDEFLAGIRTAETTVTIFPRADIAGKLLAVEADLEMFPAEEEEEATLDAGSEKAELIAKRDEYQDILRESAQEFTLRAVDDDRVDELTKIARKSCQEEADQAAKDAAGYAREECRRAEVGDKNEIRDAVRRAASSASNAVVNRAVGYHVLAEAIVDEETGAPVFTVEQIKEFAGKIGARQLQNLREAFYDMSSSDPGDFVPKSKKPGATEEG